MSLHMCVQACAQVVGGDAALCVQACVWPLCACVSVVLDWPPVPGSPAEHGASQEASRQLSGCSRCGLRVHCPQRASGGMFPSGREVRCHMRVWQACHRPLGSSLCTGTWSAASAASTVPCACRAALSLSRWLAGTSSRAPAGLHEQTPAPGHVLGFRQMFAVPPNVRGPNCQGTGGRGFSSKDLGGEECGSVVRARMGGGAQPRAPARQGGVEGWRGGGPR